MGGLLGGLLLLICVLGCGEGSMYGTSLCARRAHACFETAAWISGSVRIGWRGVELLGLGMVVGYIKRALGFGLLTRKSLGVSASTKMVNGSLMSSLLL